MPLAIPQQIPSQLITDSVSTTTATRGAGKVVRYIRPNGDDTGDGLGPLTAWKNLDKGLEWFNSLNNGTTQVLDVTSCSFYYDKQLVLGASKLGGTNGTVDFSVLGPDSQAYAYTFQIVASISASSAALTLSAPVAEPTTGLYTVSCAGQTWTVDQWRGSFLCGAGLGENVAISSNTSASLSVASTTSPTTFTAPIRIYGPGATIIAGDPNDSFTNAIILMNRSDWEFSGIRFKCTSGSKATALDVINGGALFGMQLCEVSGGMSFDSPAGFTGGTTVDYSYIHDGVFAVNSYATPQVRNSSLYKVQNISHEGSLGMIQVVIEKNSTPFGGGAVSTPAHVMSADNCLFVGSTSDAVSLTFGSSRTTACQFTQITGSAVVVDKNSWASVTSCSGSAITKFGLVVQNGAQCQIIGTKTLSGTLGGILIGATTASFVIANLPIVDATQYARVYK